MILLDTHAWIWLSSDADKLSERARKAIRTAKGPGVSAISCWELAKLMAHGRIELDRDPRQWMEDSIREHKIELLPLTPAICVVSASLSEFHGDPADRMIVATAQVHGATLVTKDKKIIESRQVPVVW